MKSIGESVGGVKVSVCILGLLFPSRTCSNEKQVVLLKQKENRKQVDQRKKQLKTTNDDSSRRSLADMKPLDEFDYRRDYLIMSRSVSSMLITDIQLILCDLGGSTSCMFFRVIFDTDSDLTENDFCFTKEQDHCSDKAFWDMKIFAVNIKVLLKMLQ